MGGSRQAGSLGGANGRYYVTDGTMIRSESPYQGSIGKASWQDLDFIGSALEAGAKLNFRFARPLCRQLIDHYCHAHGLELGLLPSAMVQCNALIDFGNDKRSPHFVNMVNTLGTEIARGANGDPARLKTPIETTFSFDMLGGCNTSGTLGNFTVNASGKLKVWDPNENGTDADWSFEGRMWWFDHWDFDRREASAPGEPGRTSRGSWRTNVGSWLTGVPYDIKTADVPVRQVRAEAKGTSHYAKWEGNPDGALLPVVHGIL